MGLTDMKNISVNSLPVNPTKLWGKEPLFGVQDALELIACCEKSNVAILGIEGFTISEKGRVPDMSQIVDFSELLKIDEKDFTRKSLGISKRFINERKGGSIYFEFVLVKMD